MKKHTKPPKTERNADVLLSPSEDNDPLLFADPVAASKVRLTPGLDPTQLTASSQGDPIVPKHPFLASEDDQIVRRDLSALQFTLPLHSPLLRPTKHTPFPNDAGSSHTSSYVGAGRSNNQRSLIAPGPIASPLVPSAEQLGLSGLLAGEGLFTPWQNEAEDRTGQVSNAHDPRLASTGPSLNSPYIRLCNALEHFVDEGIEEADSWLMSRTDPAAGHDSGSHRNASAAADTNALQLTPALERAALLNAAIAKQVNPEVTTVSRSLWLGNVDPTVTEADIRAAFAPFGSIETIRMLPARECAFVNYHAVDDAVMARSALQGMALGNLVLKIGFGKIDPQAPNSIQSHILQTSSSASQQDASRSIWVGNVGPEVTAELLMEHFNGFGPIESCRILETKGCAFVNYYSVEAAATAKAAMNGASIGGTIVKTGYAKDFTMMAMKSFGSADQLSTSHTSDLHSQNPGLPQCSSQLIHSTSQSILPLSMLQRQSTASHVHSQEGLLVIEPSAEPPSPLDGNFLRECRRAIEANPGEIDPILGHLIASLPEVCVDSYGNILMQRLIERASAEAQIRIIERIASDIPAIGMHKNGTWVIQKLISQGRSQTSIQRVLAAMKPEIVAMLEDQFGNYVVQSAIPVANLLEEDHLSSEDASEGFTFIFAAIERNCRRLAQGRFSSRALKSILEQSSIGIQRRLARALLKDAVVLCVDQNGAVVIQWLLDSEIPGKLLMLVDQIQGRIAQIALTKQGSAVIARVVASTDEHVARDRVILELYEIVATDRDAFQAKSAEAANLSPASFAAILAAGNGLEGDKRSAAPQTGAFESRMAALLKEPCTCSILLKAYQAVKPAIRLKLAHSLRSHLLEAISAALGRGFGGSELEFSQHQAGIPIHLSKLYQEIISKAI